MNHDHGHNNELIASTIPSEEDCIKIAKAFSQLGDPTRLRILLILCHSEQCVLGLSALMNMSSPAVAHHLKLLKNANLVTSRREGKEMMYKLGETEECVSVHKAVDELFHIKCFKA